MAVEVSNGGKWAFLGDGDEILIAYREAKLKRKNAKRLGSSSNGGDSLHSDVLPVIKYTPPPSFMHSPLHDVEAVYWMLWWTISYRSFAESGPPKPWQPQLYNDIFNDNKKMDYLTNENTIGGWWIYDIKGSFKEIF
jgi:hypothetical protein